MPYYRKKMCGCGIETKQEKLKNGKDNLRRIKEEIVEACKCKPKNGP